MSDVIFHPEILPFVSFRVLKGDEVGMSEENLGSEPRVTVLISRTYVARQNESSMPPRHKAILLVAALLLVLSLATSVRGLGGTNMSAFTGSNVNIDGTSGPGEWSDAYHLNFAWAWNNSSLTGGALWLKNNGTDLLLLVEANGIAYRTVPPDVYYYNLYLLFDNDNNGAVNNYEDGKALTLIFSSSNALSTLRDLHYNSTLGQYSDDTVNGTGSGSHSNPGGSGTFTWEFAIPMASGRAEDFNLPVGGSIGLEVVYNEQHFVGNSLVRSGWAYWEVSYPSGLPSGPNPSASGWAVIVRVASPPPSDNTPPSIYTPTIQPSSPGPNDPVTVSVLVTDTDSGVKNVSIIYTSDNWRSVNTTLVASYNAVSQVATVQIEAQKSGGHVAYYVVAFDNRGNRALDNNSGSYFSYNVPAPAPWSLNSWIYAGILAALGLFLLAVLLGKKRKHRIIPQNP